MKKDEQCLMDYGEALIAGHCRDAQQLRAELAALRNKDEQRFVVGLLPNISALQMGHLKAVGLLHRLSGVIAESCISRVTSDTSACLCGQDFRRHAR